MPLTKPSLLSKATLDSAAKSLDVRKALARLRSGDEGARLVEYIADALSTRNEEWFEGLPSDFLERFDDPRRNYLLMQEELCDLNLSERKLLGKQFSEVCSKSSRQKGEQFAYAVTYLDRKPDFLYLFAASNRLPRATVFPGAEFLLRGALAHYGKRRGMIVVDRNGQNFECVLLEAPSSSESEVQFGNRLFGTLRVFDHAIR